MQDFETVNQSSQGQPHSKLGMVAFAISVVGALASCSGFAIAFYAGYSGAAAGQVVDQGSSQILVSSLIILVGLMISVVSLALGIGSLFQKDRNRTLGIVSIALSALFILTFCALATFGLFFTFFLLFLRFIPIIAIAEVKAVTPQADPHHPEGGAKPGQGGHH